jgi:hypothetical protein
MKEVKHVKKIHLVVTREGVVPCETNHDVTSLWTTHPLTETLKAGEMRDSNYFHDDIRPADVFIMKQGHRPIQIQRTIPFFDLLT